MDDDSDGSGEDWSSELADADGILCYQLRLDPLMVRPVHMTPLRTFPSERVSSAIWHTSLPGGTPGAHPRRVSPGNRRVSPRSPRSR